MNRWIPTTACAALCACGSSRGAPTVEAPSGSGEGIYEFSASIPARQAGTTIRVQGTFTLVGDSLLVQSPNGCEAVVSRGPAAPNGVPSSATVRSFYCGGALLTFDRRDPVKAARWFASVPVPKQRNACVEYRTSENRRQVCVRWRPETYYTYETRSGGIQVRPIQ